MLCWRNAEITLVAGKVSTTRYSVSIAAGHLRSNHQRHEIPDMYISDISTVTQSVSQSENGSNLVQSTISPSQLHFIPTHLKLLCLTFTRFSTKQVLLLSKAQMFT